MERVISRDLFKAWWCPPASNRYDRYPQRDGKLGVKFINISFINCLFIAGLKSNLYILHLHLMLMYSILLKLIVPREAEHLLLYKMFACHGQLLHC